jgi:DNA-binding GntR family transcriptional regulator
VKSGVNKEQKQRVDGLGVVGPPALIREKTIQQLRSAIVSGYLKPGTRLVERELCEAMGVSRTSIREVLRQLETERLVDVEARRGPTVARLSYQDANEIYEVRARLEGLLLRRFVECATEKDVRDLRSIVIRFDRAASRGDISASVDVMVDFYSHLVSVARTRVIGEILEQLIARVSFLRSMSLSQPGRAKNSIREIRAILNAVQERDPSAAEKAAINHVKHAQAAAMSRLSELG